MAAEYNNTPQHEAVADASAPSESALESAKKTVSAHPYLFALAVVGLLLVLYLVFSGEHFTNRTVNMTAYRYPDPTYYKYNDRIRDPSGMDLNDYYLENDMTYKYGVGPELFGLAAFETRVVTADTMLKDSPEITVDNSVNGEHFVGGLAY